MIRQVKDIPKEYPSGLTLNRQKCNQLYEPVNLDYQYRRVASVQISSCRQSMATLSFFYYESLAWNELSFLFVEMW